MHTPGPYELAPGDESPLHLARYPTSAQVLVYAEGDCEHHPVGDFSCTHTCRDEAEQEANARLFLAAPGLLALARRVASLNRDAGEIGAGMLAQLVDEAGRLTQLAEGGE